MEAQMGTSNDRVASDLTMRIQLGDVCCSLSILDEEVFHTWRGLYENFLTDGPADVSIEIDCVDGLSETEVETAISRAKIVSEGTHFRATGLVLEAEYDCARRTLGVTAERSLLSTSLEFNLMNRLLTSAYYTACQVKHGGNPPAMLVHSCAIMRRERVLLFAGPCEVGKTTIARLCGDEYGRVLNDEMVLVSRSHRDGTKLRVQGFPTIGGTSQRLNETAPLSCVLMLKQSRRTAARRLGSMDAYLRFMPQVIMPQQLEASEPQTMLSLIAEFANEVTRAAPFFELEFTLDRERLWEAVGQLERLLDEEG